MSSEIETMGRRRLRLLEVYLLGQLAFVALLVARSAERAAVPNPPPLGGLVLVGMTLSLVVCVSCVVAYAILVSKIRRDPDLAEALDDELVRAFFSQSWAAAFAAAERWDATGAGVAGTAASISTSVAPATDGSSRSSEPMEGVSRSAGREVLSSKRRSAALVTAAPSKTVRASSRATARLSRTGVPSSGSAGATTAAALLTLKTEAFTAGLAVAFEGVVAGGSEARASRGGSARECLRPGARFPGAVAISEEGA